MAISITNPPSAMVHRYRDRLRRSLALSAGPNELPFFFPRVVGFLPARWRENGPRFVIDEQR